MCGVGKKRKDVWLNKKVYFHTNDINSKHGFKNSTNIFVFVILRSEM